MATFEESVAEQKKLHEFRLQQIQEEVDERLAAEKRITEEKTIALKAQREAILTAMEEEKAANGSSSEDYKKLLAEEKALKGEIRTEEENFFTRRSTELDKEEKKAKKRHGAAISRIRLTQAAYEGIKGVVSSTFELLKQTVLEGEKVAQTFRRSTGGSRAFVEELTVARRELAFFGKGTAEAEQMLMTLNEGFTDFQRLSTDQSEDLIMLTTTMGQLGFGTDVMADSMNMLVGQFDMGVGAIEEFSLTIAGTAKNMGMDPGALGKQTIELAGNLSRLGPRAVGTALEFAKLERQFGVSAESLLQFSDKFDTFDSAQDTVGQLNATFGTTLNSMDLMAMKEEERAVFLMDNLKQQGVNFKQLSKFQRQNLAEVTGMNVADLDRLSNSRKAFDTEMMARKKAEETGIKFMSITDKIKGFFQQMTINAAPLINALIKLGDEVMTKLLLNTRDANRAFTDLTGNIIEPLGVFLFDTGKYIFETLIPGLQKMAVSAIPLVKQAFQDLQPFFNGVKEIFGMILSGDFEGAMGKFKAAAFPVLKSLGSAIADGLKSAIGAKLQGAKDYLMGGSIGGAAAGAASGAAIGSFIPFLGTAIGGLIGGLGGYFMGMAGGGPAPYSGTVMTGERGPEMMNVPRGAYVTSNAMMRHGVTPPGATAAAATNTSGRGATINMYMDGKKISSAVMARINEENNIVMA